MAAEQRAGDMDDTSLKISKVPWNGTELLFDSSTGTFRPVVPLRFRRPIFDSIHGLSHPGARPSIKLVAARFIWPGLRQDMREWCRTCHQCQSSKVARHIKAPISTFAPADRRFGSLHLDLVGPLPPSEDFRYLLTIVDRFSRWPEAIPLRDVSAASCTRVFVRSWVSRHGVPDEVITDRGAQFTGALWRELMSSLGIKASTTTAYHPQANGLVERMHRQLKAALKANLEGTDNWMDVLPLVLLGLRSVWREGPDCSPAEMVFGTSLRIPGQFVPGAELGETPSNSFVQTLADKMRSLRPAPSSHRPSSSSSSVFIPPSLMRAKQVYIRHDAVRRPLQRPYDGPYDVITPGEKSFVVSRQGQPYSVSVDRLKPALSAPGIPSSVGPPPSSPVVRPSSSPVSLPWTRSSAREDVPPLDDQELFPPLPTKTLSGRISRPPVCLNL